MTPLLTRLWLPVAIWRAERRIRRLVGARCPFRWVGHIGATEIDPRHLAFWIAVETDAQRDALVGDEVLGRQLRDALRAAGYPAAPIEHVGFAFESQETVDRDYEGSWWYAMK